MNLTKTISTILSDPNRTTYIGKFYTDLSTFVSHSPFLCEVLVDHYLADKEPKLYKKINVLSKVLNTYNIDLKIRCSSCNTSFSLLRLLSSKSWYYEIYIETKKRT